MILISQSIYIYITYYNVCNSSGDIWGRGNIRFIIHLRHSKHDLNLCWRKILTLFNVLGKRFNMMVVQWILGYMSWPRKVTHLILILSAVQFITFFNGHVRENFLEILIDLTFMWFHRYIIRLKISRLKQCISISSYI